MSGFGRVLAALVWVFAICSASHAKTYRYDITAEFQGVQLGTDLGSCVTGTRYAPGGCQSPALDAFFFTPQEFANVSQQTPYHLATQPIGLAEPIAIEQALYGSFKFDADLMAAQLNNGYGVAFRECSGLLNWVCFALATLDTNTLNITEASVFSLRKVDAGNDVFSLFDDSILRFTADGFEYHTLGPTYTFAISSVSLTAVPVPGALLAALTGLLSLFGMHRVLRRF